MKSGKYHLIILLILSIGLTGVTVKLSHNISKQYFISHSFFWDPVMTYSKNIPFYKRMQEEAHLNQVASRINFAKLYFNAEPKAPLYCIPIVLFSPELLLSPWVTLPVTAVMYCIFLFVLGYSIYLHSKNLLYSITVMFLLSAAPVLLDPYRGLSAGWIDMPAGFLLASAVLAFLNWHTFRKAIWLIAFSVLISFAVLGRYIVSVYGIMLIFPVFIYSLVNYYKLHHDFIKCFLKPILYVLIICGVLCGYFLFIHFGFTWDYYTKLSLERSDSIIGNVIVFVKIFKIIGLEYIIFVLLFLSLWFIYHIIKKQKLKFKKIILFSWLIFILPFFWIVIFKNAANYHTELIELSVFFILFLPLGTLQNFLLNKKPINYICGLVIIISIFFFVNSYDKFSYEADNPSEIQKDSKALDIKIADYVKELKPGQTWSAFFDSDYSRIPNCECFYRYGIYPDKYSTIAFYTYDEFWNFWYPDLSSDIIADSICNGIDNLSLMITFNDIKDIDKSNVTNINKFPIANKVAKKVVTYMQTKDNWEKSLVYPTSMYSDLAFYIKRQ